MPAGTFLTVRVNQLLSSDKNQEGDAFSATLTRPVVINGVVVAEPGQTWAAAWCKPSKPDALKASRSRVQLTDLELVDGQQIPIKSSLVSRTGPSSAGQDAGTILGATGLGAAVGAAAAWGKARDRRWFWIVVGCGWRVGDARPSERSLSGADVDVPH